MVGGGGGGGGVSLAWLFKIINHFNYIGKTDSSVVTQSHVRINRIPTLSRLVFFQLQVSIGKGERRLSQLGRR